MTCVSRARSMWSASRNLSGVWAMKYSSWVLSLWSMMATLRPSATISNRAGSAYLNDIFPGRSTVSWPSERLPPGAIWTKSALSTRAASSQALARATASAADRLAAGPLFGALAALTGFCRSSGASWAIAPAADERREASAIHRIRFAIRFQSSCPSSDAASYRIRAAGKPLASPCGLNVTHAQRLARPGRRFAEARLSERAYEQAPPPPPRPAARRSPRSGSRSR